jgi:EAL domain-containing protein (putative c-di-GMP-specific phosphodiesterase class I)
LEEACNQNKRWQQAGHAFMPVAVNLSARQFADADLVERVSSALSAVELAPQWLELEITETAAMTDLWSSVHF